MSADRKVWLTVLLLGTAGAVMADDEQPDMDFLEYLGRWEESDEEWLIFADANEAKNGERSDPEPEGEESTENDDEG